LGEVELAEFTVTSTVKVSDRLLSTPFTTHEAVLAIAEALVTANPFEAAEIAILLDYLNYDYETG